MLLHHQLIPLKQKNRGSADMEELNDEQSHLSLLHFTSFLGPRQSLPGGIRKSFRFWETYLNI